MKPKMKFVAAAVLACASVTATAADKILLKTPIAFGTHLPALGTPIKWVSERITAVTGNTIKMKVYEPGKLVAPLKYSMRFLLAK